MRNLYNAVHLTDEQKVAYIRVLAYLAKADHNPDYIEQNFTEKVLDRMNLSKDILKKIFIPRNNEELYRALMPICTRPIAIDLLHCLWFAASVNTIISDDEIIGMCICGPAAADLIHEIGILLNEHIKISRFKDYVFAHPTLSEILKLI